MRTTVVLVLATLALVPVIAPAQSGYAYGADHCYSFRAPVGWQLDNQAAAANGVPMVFYPNGSTWQSAEVVMYTRPSPQLQQGAAAIAAQVADVIAMYRAHSQTVVAKQIGQVPTQADVSGQLWSFSGYRNGGTELAVYFLGRQTVNYFVAQVPRGASVESAQRVLVELASTYREATDCKPCGGARSCKRAD